MGLPLLLAFSAPLSGCQTIEGDAILARDVAAVVPAFAEVSADLNLGYAPQSGAPRILRGIDLQRIAKNRGLDLTDLPDVCFERETFVPSAAQIADAMRASLGIADAKIQIASSSQRPAPAGDVFFPLDGLQYSPAQAETLWRGYVRYQGNRDFPIWARVRITHNTTRVIAVSNIPAGKPIRENQVRLESCEDSPLDQTAARSLDEVVGYVPKASLRIRTAIRKTQLDRPPDVHRGDSVKVHVFEGAAHLEFEGQAETAGAKGSTILVRNVSSGKDFKARVTGTDQVTVGDSIQ